MRKELMAISLIGFLFTGCSSSNFGSNATLGTTLGAVAGAALGAGVSGKKDRDRGAIIGAGLGSVVGGAIGYSLDKQANEVAKSLGTNVSQQENYSDIISVMKEENRIKISIKDKMMFKTNSYNPTEEAQKKLKQLSNVLKDYPQTIIQIVGHTDNRGTYEYNYRLSERRALSVLKIFEAMKLPNEIRTAGCSYLKPLVPNNSTYNMGLNRRVEIYLYPDTKFIVNSCK